MNLERLRRVLLSCTTPARFNEIARQAKVSEATLFRLLPICRKMGLIERKVGSRPAYVATEAGHLVLKALSESESEFYMETPASTA